VIALRVALRCFELLVHNHQVPRSTGG